MPYSAVDTVAKLIPFGSSDIKSALATTELKELYLKDEATRKLIDMSCELEGMPRHA